MKRGNTALKRAVSVASVAAMGLALAVVAAPAASAWTGTPFANASRATPAVDAPWIADPANPLYTAEYTDVDGAGTASTGEVPNIVIGQTFQTAAGLQILLPATAGVPAWANSDKVLVTLSGATFSQVPTGISVGARPIVKAGLDAKAGHVGTNATAVAPSGTGGLNSAALAAAPVLNGAKTTLSITLPNTANNVAGSTGDAYLLSIDNIRLSVAADASGSAVTPVVATVTADPAGAFGTSASTIAYVNNLKLALNGDATITGTTVKLPPIVVTEAAKDSFANGADSFDVTVSGTPAVSGGTITVTAPAGASLAASATVTDTGAALTFAGNFSLTSPVATVNWDGSSTTAVETAVISGLEVTGVKAGTELTVSVTDPTGSTGDSGSFAHTPDQSAGASVTVTPGSVLPRIAGDNRYETAADIAIEVDATNAVILANGENAKQGIDALSANFLAGVKSAPILLTPANSLATETKDALTELFKDSTADITIYVMGKTDAVSQAVRDAAEAAVEATSVSGIATVTVKEIAGSDRYATSVASVNEAGSVNIASYNLGKGNLRTAFLASGQTNADALAAGAVSAGSQIPVFLTTNGDELPASVSDALTADHIDQVVILGATDRVSQKVEDDLTAAGKNVIRLAGTDRFDTAAMIAALDRDAPTDGTGRATGADVYIANGLDGFPDALAIGPLAGKSHASLVTVSNGATLPAPTATFLKDNKASISLVHAVGGNDRVQDAVITAAQDALK